MNLLDKASIVLTASAYDNGKVLCVKPSDGSGDMDFSRNSAATRVNAQGLVEDVQILSSNLVQNGSFSEEGAEEVSNGSFSNGETDWTLGTGWSIGEDKAVADILGYVDLRQGGVFEVGKKYKVLVQTLQSNSGVLRLYNGSTLIGEITSVNSYVFYITATSDLLSASSSSAGFNGSITNISVKEVGQNWTLQTGWSIGDDKAVVTNAPNLYQRLTQPSLSFNLNSTYKISITCSEYSSGFVYLRKPRGAEPDTSLKIDSVGTFVFTLNALTELTEFALAIGALGTDLSITNISAIEITNDTNLPRISYENFSFDGSGNIISGSGCGSWLWEPQSTNLITQSELFSDSYWTKSGASVVSGFSSPDGGANAFKLVEDTSSSTHEINSSNITVTIGNNYTLSSYCKPSERDWIKIFPYDFGRFVGSPSAYFNVSTGVIGTYSDCTPKIELLSNGWYRVSISVECSSTGGSRHVSRLAEADNDTSYTGDGTSGLFIWGAQLEQQSYATSYIPTSGTQKTRNQDVCNNGGSVSTINSTEGVLYAEIAALSLGASASLGLNDGSGANRVLILLQGNGDIRGFIASNSAIVFDEIYSGISTLNNNKIAISYKLNQFTLWINGVKRFTDTIGNTPIGLNQLDFNNGSGATDFYGKTKCLAVWKEVLSDENLAELTTI